MASDTWRRHEVVGFQERQPRKEAFVKTIVIGFDGSESSGRALDRAAELAQALDAALVVASVTVPKARMIPNPVVPAEPLLLTGPVISGDESDETGRLLEEARERVAGREVEVVPMISSPADALIELADERAADIIVVGTHEPGFLERLLAGSVSADVSRRAHCDVLIVH